MVFFTVKGFCRGKMNVWKKECLFKLILVDGWGVEKEGREKKVKIRDEDCGSK